MVPQESRTYQLAKAALLAVLIAVTPVTVSLRAQAKPAAAAPAAEDPLSLKFKEAEATLNEKKYKEAIALYETIEKENPTLEDRLKAVLSFRKGICHYMIKDWPRAEAELSGFLTKYPRGTEDFFDEKDNRRGVVELTLIEVLSKQAKFDAALQRLEKIRTNTLARPEERVNAFALSAQIVIDRTKNAPEEEKRAAYAQAIGLLKQATAGGVRTPEAREAAYKLVEVYAKLGLTKEADQLKAEIDASSSGSPAEIVRSNFQKLEIGDARFASAENAAEEKDRYELYRQALANYQGTLRRSSLARILTRAIETKQADIDNNAKNIPKPNAEQKAQLEASRADLAQFKKIETEFNANQDYDAFISYRIGLCLLELNRPWEAFVAFRDIFDNSPKFSRITGTYFYYITSLRRTGRSAEAQAKCKEFIQKYPKAEEVSLVGVTLGEISQEREDYKEAIEHYKWVKSNVQNLPKDALEEIDFRIASCLFAQVDWKDASAAFDAFLKAYPRSPVRQQVLYMNALCWFYQGKYKETKAAFDAYQSEYPKGQFTHDVRYRQAIVVFGTNTSRANAEEAIKLCQEWLADFGKIQSDEIVSQLPEVHTLIGDANIRIAETYDKPIRDADIDVRINARSPDKAKYVAIKAGLEKAKEEFTVKAIDAYELAAKTAKTNPSALEFVVRELSKMLPGRGEHRRMRAIYQELYDWDHKAPKALTYLYEVIKSTERLGDRPEFQERTEKAQKEFGAKLAEARAKVDDMERKGATKEAIAEAKNGVTKLSADLAAALAVIEKDRQESIKRAKDNALSILSKAVAENINDRTQEGAEKLIIFLAEKLAKKIKRVKPGAKPEPGAYTSADAEAEMTKLLRLSENRDSLVAQARGFFALGQLAAYTREPAKTDANFRKIAANYKAEELSPTILAIVGDHLLAKGDHAKAAEYFGYIMEHGRSSEYADYGFAGVAEIALAKKDFKKALELTDEAIDNNILMSKELEIRFVRARALAEIGKYPEAKKEFEEIAKTKEWRGEKTAASLYWLGLMEERQGLAASKAEDRDEYAKKAVAYYRRCYMSWKRYETWSAKAYLAAAKLLNTTLNQKPEARLLINEMLTKDRIKDTPEAAEAKDLLLKL